LSSDLSTFTNYAGYGVAEAPIYTIDLKSKRVATLPGSVGLFAPRWSPDGRYIVAVTAQQPLKLMLFDVTTQKWTKLYSSEIGYPSWSHDGKYIYFQDWLNQNAPVRLSRIRISDRSIETIVQFKNLGRLTAGTIIDWSGLAPDDSPLLARDISSQEVYALDWQAP
jgi:Tol biopolymer transport system component